jgi:hypothetical protein
MLDSFLFKNKKNGINHIGIGIDEVRSLCGSATYYAKSVNPDMRKVGEKMKLDRLIIAHSKICSRCLVAANKQIESENAYLEDAKPNLKPSW